MTGYLLPGPPLDTRSWHATGGVAPSTPGPSGHSFRRTALIFTFHDWPPGRRVAGFHKIAEALCEHGFEVGFANEGRSLYGLLLRRDPRFHLRPYLRALAGRRYPVATGSVFHFTTIDLQLPERLLPPDQPTASLLRSWSHRVLLRRCSRLFPAPRLIVLESTTAVLMLDEILSAYPNTPIVYRASDPLPTWVVSDATRRLLLEAERRVTRTAVSTLLPDAVYETLYRSLGYGFRATPHNPQVLRNGIDVRPFRAQYPCPSSVAHHRRYACYAGGHRPDYACIAYAARRLPGLDFVVVCPERPSRAEATQLKRLPNLTYVDGVPPDEVPAYVTNAAVVMAPYRRHVPSLHGKILQAMAAFKPVVALGVSSDLARLGVRVALCYEDFAAMLEECLQTPVVHYEVDVFEHDWARFKSGFLDMALEAKIL